MSTRRRLWFSDVVALGDKMADRIAEVVRRHADLLSKASLLVPA